MAYDEALAERIRRHQESRGIDFPTLEEPLALVETMREIKETDVVVVDCLTLWLANLLLEGKTAAEIEHFLRRRRNGSRPRVEISPSTKTLPDPSR